MLGNHHYLPALLIYDTIVKLDHYSKYILWDHFETVYVQRDSLRDISSPSINNNLNIKRHVECYEMITYVFLLVYYCYQLHGFIQTTARGS